MQTLSLARRTCIASASAVECTATVLMPISRQARWTRSAISPRFAMRTFSNMRWRLPLLDHEKRLAEFDRLAVIDENARELAGTRRRNVVHGLHGLDDEDRLPFGDIRA